MNWRRGTPARPALFDPSSDYLMVCGQWSGFLLTAVERRSGYLVIRKVQDKRSSTVNASIIRIFEDIDRSKIKTLTFDNGPESYDPEPLERAFHCRTYFCDPYNSGQRGTNENTNGLARQYLRKGLPYGLISYRDVLRVQDRLNTRPRKRLHYATPSEIFNN
ncbi:MAG: IS30 family transposase [Planctomycetota bacterium]